MDNIESKCSTCKYLLSSKQGIEYKDSLGFKTTAISNNNTSNGISLNQDSFFCLKFNYFQMTTVDNNSNTVADIKECIGFEEIEDGEN